MAESEQTGTLRTRRSLLTAAAGGAAALAVSAIRPGAVAAAPANMQTELDNPTTEPTGVTNSESGELALYGHAAGDGGGLEGTSVTGPGVTGISTDTSDPENDILNTGVVGVAGDAGNTAANKSLTGVYGYADPSPEVGFVGAGVWGDAPEFGVIGTGSIGTYGEGGFGVLGFTTASDGIGVYASVDVASALALRVEGRAEFTRSGRATVKGGAKKRTISLSGITSSSLVFAVLASNRAGRWVRAVVPSAGQFIVYLNDDVTSDTTVTWIAFTNPANHSG